MNMHILSALKVTAQKCQSPKGDFSDRDPFFVNCQINSVIIQCTCPLRKPWPSPDPLSTALLFLCMTPRNLSVLACRRGPLIPQQPGALWEPLPEAKAKASQSGCFPGFAIWFPLSQRVFLSGPFSGLNFIWAIKSFVKENGSTSFVKTHSTSGVLMMGNLIRAGMKKWAVSLN